MSQRNNQKQLWADPEFIKRLEIIKAKRLLKNVPVKNLGQLTKEFLNLPAFEKLEQELLQIDVNSLGFKVRMDKKRLLP